MKAIQLAPAFQTIESPHVSNVMSKPSVVTFPIVTWRRVFTLCSVSTACKAANTFGTVGKVRLKPT